MRLNLILCSRNRLTTVGTGTAMSKAAWHGFENYLNGMVVYNRARAIGHLP